MKHTFGRFPPLEVCFYYLLTKEAAIIHIAVTQFLNQLNWDEILGGPQGKRWRGDDVVNGLLPLFLDQVLGPVLNYHFYGVRVEFPFKDFKGRQRFIDVHIGDEYASTCIELDGFTVHARDVKPEQFDDHLERQNDLLLQGWHLLRFSSGMLINQPELCQRQVMQAIARYHYIPDRAPLRDRQQWSERRRMLLRIANHHHGIIKVNDVARIFRVKNQTAARWLRRMAADGIILPSSGEQRITGYRLNIEPQVTAGKVGNLKHRTRSS